MKAGDVAADDEVADHAEARPVGVDLVVDALVLPLLAGGVVLGADELERRVGVGRLEHEAALLSVVSLSPIRVRKIAEPLAEPGLDVLGVVEVLSLVGRLLLDQLDHARAGVVGVEHRAEGGLGVLLRLALRAHGRRRRRPARSRGRPRRGPSPRCRRRRRRSRRRGPRAAVADRNRDQFPRARLTDAAAVPTRR